MPPRKLKPGEAAKRAAERLKGNQQGPKKVYETFVLRFDPRYSESALSPQKLPFLHFIVLISSLGRNIHELSQLAAEGIPDELITQIHEQPLPGCWWDYYIVLRREYPSFASRLWREFCEYFQCPIDEPCIHTKTDAKCAPNEDTAQPTLAGRTTPSQVDCSANADEDTPQYMSADTSGGAGAPHPPQPENAPTDIPRRKRQVEVSTDAQRLTDKHSSSKRCRHDAVLSGPSSHRYIEYPGPMANATKVSKIFPGADLRRIFAGSAGVHRCATVRMYGFSDGGVEVEVDLDPGVDATLASWRACETFSGLGAAIHMQTIPRLFITVPAATVYSVATLNSVSELLFN